MLVVNTQVQYMQMCTTVMDIMYSVYTCILTLPLNIKNQYPNNLQPMKIS